MGRFRFGMPLAIIAGRRIVATGLYGKDSVERAINNAYRTGFDYVEFDLNTLFPEKLSEKDIKTLKRLKDYPLEIAFHAPLVGIDVTHPINEIRNASLKVLTKCIRFAERFDGVYFNFHLEPYYLWLEHVRKEVRENAFESIRRLIDASEINITIENTSIGFGISMLKELLKEKKLHLCFDVGHAIKFHSCRGEKEWMRIIEKWCNLFGKRMLVAHLHDCVVKKNGITDHLPLSTGRLNAKKIFDSLKRTACKYVLFEFFRTSGRKSVGLRHFAKALTIARDLCK